MNQGDIDRQLAQEIHMKDDSSKRAKPRERRCGICGKPGHSARTCQEDGEVIDGYKSE